MFRTEQTRNIIINKYLSSPVAPKNYIIKAIKKGSWLEQRIVHQVLIEHRMYLKQLDLMSLLKVYNSLTHFIISVEKIIDWK